MTDLFSIFRPITLGLGLNWLSIMVVIISLPRVYWVTNNPVISTIFWVLDAVHKEFSSVVGKTINPGRLLIPLRIFIYIILNNSFGLLPYVFTARSHLVFTIRISLPLWLGHTVFAWVKRSENMFSHLVPLRTPFVLIPFIVLIELIRRIIRPLTLAVRLAANIVAGHLLLCLLCRRIPLTGIIVVFLFSVLLIIEVLELAVALIQSYVFRILITLYLKEVDRYELR